MYRIVTILSIILLFPLVLAQEMTVKSFTEKTSDLTASTQIREDNNGTPCALVKVQLVKSGAQFGPNVIGEVSFHVNEYWYFCRLEARI